MTPQEPVRLAAADPTLHRSRGERTRPVVLLAVGALLAWYLFRVAEARLTAEVLLAGASRFLALGLAAAMALGLVGALRGREVRVVAGCGRPPADRSVPPRTPSEAHAVAAHAIVFEPGRTPRRVELKAGELVVGTSRGCELRVEAEEVAPRHCLLRVAQSGRVEVRDLGSRAGTQWDGRTLTIGTVRLEVTP